jgi:hypothetical protein
MNTCYGIDKLLETEIGNTRIYRVTEHELSENKVFKAFRSNDIATIALKYQKKLAKYNLAPKAYTRLFQINDPEKKKSLSGWGFVTEKAEDFYSDANPPPYYGGMRKLQKLVEDIAQKTKLKFWDCHYDNVGYIIRDKKPVLVCIDTGKESFRNANNAWGYANPGPKCSYCLRYACRCK